MEEMFSIKEILQSEKFQRESPEKLKRLITRTSPFSPMPPTNSSDRADRRANQNTNGEQKKRRVNGVQMKKLNQI